MEKEVENTTSALYKFIKQVQSFVKSKAKEKNNQYKSSSLKRTIRPKVSTAFYVVTLSNRRISGILRTGLSLREQNLFYKISCYSSTPDLSLMDEKEINCGKINLKNFKFRK